MPVLDLTQGTRNVVELTNNITQVRVELNAGLLLSETVAGGGASLPSATVGQLLQYNGTDWVAVDLSTVLPTATTGQYLQWDGTNWVAVTLSTSGGALTSDIVTTDSAGNINAGTTLTAGTTFETIFNDMLVSYQSPTMSLSGWTTGNYEHGHTFTDTNFTLAFTNDSNINTGVTASWAFTDSFITGASGTTSAADGSTTTGTITGQLLVTNSNAGTGATYRNNAAKLTVSGAQNTNGGTINSASRQSSVFYRFWVLESTTTVGQNPSNATVQSLLSGADTSLNGTGSDVIHSGLIGSVSNLGFTATGGHDYIYFLLPQAFTVNNITQNTSINLYAGDTADQTTAVIYLGTVNINNQHGESVAMQLLRTKVSNAYASGSVIAFS